MNKSIQDVVLPNKIFVFDFITRDTKYNVSYLIVIAAKNQETAEHFLFYKKGCKAEARWLMGAWHETIYENNGEISFTQAKILYIHNIVQ